MRLPTDLPELLRATGWRRALTPLGGWPDRLATVADVLLWLLFTAVVSVELSVLAWVQNSSPGETAVRVGGAALLSALLVVLSRTYPLAALALVTLATTWVSGYSVPMIVVSYLVGRRLPHAAPALMTFAAIIVVGGVYQVANDPLDAYAWLTGGVLLGLNGVLPWLVGIYRRQHQQLSDAGWARARQLEREQRIGEEQVRLKERSRIAQDMHDSLGHELSLIALRAGALEVAPDLAEHHRHAAAELRTSATVATERLQEIIGVLREDAAPSPTAPAGQDVEALVDRARASGMEVRLERYGPAADLPTMVDRAAYRVVQEALTNATKHAPGAAVLVRLVHDRTTSVVTVSNTPPPAGPLPGNVRGGRGLVALAERVRLAGGRLRAEAHHGGFLVHAWFDHRHAVRRPTGDAAEDDPGQDTAGLLVNTEMHATRRRMRRGFIGAAVTLTVLVPTTMGGIATVEMSAAREQVLEPDVYVRLRVGQPTEEVEDLLPEQEFPTTNLPSLEAEPDRPAATDCRYYRDSDEIFQPVQIYRLCFHGGVLMAKDSFSIIAPR